MPYCGTMLFTKAETGPRHFNNLCPLQERANCRRSIKRIERVVASTVTRELFTVKNMFRKAVEWGYLKENPAAAVKKLKSGTPLFRYLSREESAALLDSCKQSENPQLHPFVFTALNSGMRLGEITSLECKCIGSA
jgi:site-specific recombinase XerD